MEGGTGEMEGGRDVMAIIGCMEWVWDWPMACVCIIYTIILLKSVCRCSQTAGCNSCSIVSGNVANCSYRLTVYPVTSSRLNSA